MITVVCAISAQQAVALVRGYRNAAPGVQQGMVLRSGVDQNGNAQLQPASKAAGDNVVGISTDVPQDAETSRDAEGVVFIESGGDVAALVTNKGGPINAGDKLTLSDVPGVLTKLSGDGVVFAVAQEPYSTERSQTLNLAIGAVEVSSIRVAFGESSGPTTVDPALSGVRQFGDGIVSSDISSLRLLLAALITLSGLVFVSVMMYGAIENGMYSVGRNPLARRTILFAMFRVIAVSVALLAAVLGIVFIILQ